MRKPRPGDCNHSGSGERAPAGKSQPSRPLPRTSLDCSTAPATDALKETDAGYAGPLNLDRTLVRSFAISSADAYRSEGSFASAFWTMRSSARKPGHQLRLSVAAFQS